MSTMSSRRSEPPPPLSHRGIAVVGIRLLSLYLILRFLDAVVLTVLPATEPLSRATWFAVLLPLLVALLLWFGVGVIASWMVPARRTASPEPAPLRLPPAADGVFAAVGLILLIDGLADLAVLWPTVTLPLWPLAPDLLGPVLRIAAGAVVFVGAHGIARLHLWLRYAGH